MSSRGQKRKKVSLACVECRERKRKCDGGRPSCGNCSRRRPPAECVYPDESLRRGSSGYVEALRTRIRELELQVQSQNAQSTSTGHTTASPPTSDHPHDLTTRPGLSNVLSYAASGPSITLNQATPQEASPATSWSARTTRPPNLTTSAYIALPTGESSGDPSSLEEDEHGGSGIGFAGIGSMGTPWSPRCYHCRGRRPHSVDLPETSHSVDFDYQIREWTAGTDEYTGLFDEDSSAPIKICRCWAGRKLNISRAAARWVLPDRAQADSYVEGYFEHVYILYPYLIRPQFMHNYLQIWQPRLSDHLYLSETLDDDADSDVFFCLLNAVLALGVQFDTEHDAKWKASMGQLFYRRAITSLKYDGLERGTIELVQTHVLIAQYLQTTQMWEACWNIAGLAIRIAQGIGLHINPANIEVAKRHPSFIVEEAMRRRTWAGCVSLDRMLALLYGKPEMVHPSVTRDWVYTLPYFPDEAVMAGSETVIHRPHLLEFFTQTLKQQDILGGILELRWRRDDFLAYLNPDSSTIVEKGSTLSLAHLQALRKLDERSVKLFAQRPQHLDMNVSSPGTVFGKQARVTHIRYFHVRIFMLRPVLLEYHKVISKQGIDGDPASTQFPAHLETLRSVAKECVESARSMIGIVFDDEFGRQSPANLWWYGMYYAYFCAAVLHAGRLCTQITDFMPDTVLQESFEKCIRCLQKYEVHGTAAKICRNALEVLERRAFPTPIPPQEMTESSLYPSEATYQTGNDIPYNSDQQMYALQPEYSAMQGGWFGGVEPARLIGGDAEYVRDIFYFVAHSGALFYREVACHEEAAPASVRPITSVTHCTFRSYSRGNITDQFKHFWSLFMPDSDVNNF